VVTTPHFVKTGADGKARLEAMTAGSYEARVWHPRMRGASEKTTKPITLADEEPASLAFTLSLRPDSRPARRRDPYERQPGG